MIQIARARLMTVKCDFAFHQHPHQEQHARNACKWIRHDHRIKAFRALVTTGA